MPKRAAKTIEAERTAVADQLQRGEISEEEAAEQDAKLVAELTGESSESEPSTDR